MFHGFHGTSEIRFPAIQVSSKGVGATTGHFGRFLQIQFPHEIGDLDFIEVAVDKLQGLFGNAEVFWIGRVQRQRGGGGGYKTPNTLLPRKARITV